MIAKHFQFSVLCLSLVLLNACASTQSLSTASVFASGQLSNSFYQKIQPFNERIALYVTPQDQAFLSERIDEPTYHVGDALTPMLIEAFQSSFDEFVFMEVQPTAEIISRYDITYLIHVKVKDFQSDSVGKERMTQVSLEAEIFNAEHEFEVRYEADGKNSISKSMGAADMGNSLNRALENAITPIIESFHEYAGEKAVVL